MNVLVPGFSNGLRHAVAGPLLVALLLVALPGPACVLDWDGGSSLCGNGVIDSGEECDDGQAGAKEGCSASCKIDHGYHCVNEPSVCTTTCGDGIIAPGVEECDQEQSPPTSYDGCSADCREEPNWTCSGEPSTCVPGL